MAQDERLKDAPRVMENSSVCITDLQLHNNEECFKSTTSNKGKHFNKNN